MPEAVATKHKGETPSQIYRNFIQRGFDPTVSARLTASMYGLPVAEGNKPINWTLKEISKILFLSYRVSRGDV